LRVVDRLELREDPDFLEPRDYPYSDAEVLELVSKNVDAQLRRGTRLIDVAVRDRNPERARDIADTFIDEFQSLIREQNGASAAKSRDRLGEEATNQLTRVNAAEDKVQEFRIQHAEIALDEDNDFVSEKLSDLDKKLASATTEALLRKGEFINIKRSRIRILSRSSILDPMVGRSTFKICYTAAIRLGLSLFALKSNSSRCTPPIRSMN